MSQAISKALDAMEEMALEIEALTANDKIRAVEIDRLLEDNKWAGEQLILAEARIREAYEAGYCDGAYKCELGKTDMADHYNEWVAAGRPPAPENA